MDRAIVEGPGACTKVFRGKSLTWFGQDNYNLSIAAVAKNEDLKRRQLLTSE
jgi:hypothetical protein